MAHSLYYLSVGLGLLFCAAGITKVVPVEPAYGTQVTTFNRLVTVFPFQSFTGYRPTADLYRAVVGVIEIAFGVLLAFGTYNWHRYACLVLLCVMGGAMYSLVAVGDPVQNIVIPVIFGGVLLFLISRERHYY